MMEDENVEAANSLIHYQRRGLDTDALNGLQELNKIFHDFPMMRLYDKNSFSSCLTKKLMKSDVDYDQGRFLIPTEFVTAEINPLLKDGVECSYAGIPVTVYTPFNEFEMMYRSRNNNTHVLTSGWKELSKDCNLKVNDTIYLWVFRHVLSEKLCFAISKSD